MRASLPWQIAVLAVVAAAACGGERTASQAGGPSNVSAALGGELVARVGDVPIHRKLVLAVARARGISASEALRVLVDEELFAQAAHKANADSDGAVQKDTAAALSRAFLATLRTQALAAGPWTDAEITTAMGARWIELERPETRTVIHALVKKDTPQGAALAERLRAELVTATGTDAVHDRRAFEERAKAFAMPAGHTLTVEDIPPITADGRVATPDAAAGGGGVVPDFAKGVFAVPQELGTTQVIETEFGLHVARVLVIRPPHVATRVEKVRALEAELISLRAKPQHDALLDRLRKEGAPSELATPDDLGRPR